MSIATSINGREAVHGAKHFDEAHILHELAHYLPSQTPLKDFVHHNTMHAFQHLKFYEAIFKASGILGFQPTIQLNEFRKLHQIGRIRLEVLERAVVERKGKVQSQIWLQRCLNGKYDSSVKQLSGLLRANWKTCYQIDLDNLVHPLLFRIICGYLDQGVSLWQFPFVDQGLIPAIRALESRSCSSFFNSKRAKALLFEEEASLERLLGIVVGDERFYVQYLYDQQFAHRGWSGMVATIEQRPDSILYPKSVSLRDFVKLELLLEIDALDQVFGENGWEPLAKKAKQEPFDLFADRPMTEVQEVLSIWQDAFEWSYYDEVLSGLQHLKGFSEQADPNGCPSAFQAIFCIDEREGSLRRHLEAVAPNCETLGCPGFFGVSFYFHPAGGKFYEKLCPANVTPKHLVKEKEASGGRGHDILYSKYSHTLFRGLLASLSLGVWAAVKLFLDLFRPKMSPAISNAFAHMNLDAELEIENTDPANRENGLQVGFTVAEMADIVENLLRGIGMVECFAPIVYVVGHGSSSANNPHHGAHDCGACSGRPGSVNARVFAAMANHAKVRALLAERGLNIPDATQFVGALHDTASDEMAFYDVQKMSERNKTAHLNEHVGLFEQALNLNAKERSRRFASINTKADIKKVREAIRRRSVSYFEPRPELGHGTNALCFVGHRRLTKGLFFDRRAFMNSYDHRTDPHGERLLGVMRPLPPVCGGINLEYYFSRVDNYKLGAGTKLPHNVMGLIGVANSSDGDLRPGLPLQMIEVHDPVRLLILVEHYPEVVLNTIRKEDSLYEWFANEWVHLVAISPADNSFHYFKNGAFAPYVPLLGNVEAVGDIHSLFENAKKMDTNYIVDATQENLPVLKLK